MNVAVLGGSFNPPHLAHLLACRTLLEEGGFDQVWLVPCFRHAFAKELADFEHRRQMCRLLAEPFSGRVLVSDVERDVLDRGLNRTLDTMEHLSGAHPQHRFTLAVGSDLLPELPLWKGFERLSRHFPIFVLRRPGHPVAGERRASADEMPAVSSTQVRELVAAGRPIAALVPGPVAEYILRHGLYRRPAGAD